MSERRLDTDKVDDSVLALLLLGLHDEYGSVWKGFDWGALDRLHTKGMISDPRSKAKSVALSSDGREKAEALFEAMFTKP